MNDGKNTVDDDYSDDVVEQNLEVENTCSHLCFRKC
jgi:hypothetical protein